MHAVKVGVDHDAVAIDPEVIRMHHDAALGSGHGHVGRHRQIESQVYLLVDFLSLVHVGPVIGELRLHL